MAQDEDLSVSVGLTEAQYKRALARIEANTQRTAKKAERQFQRANRSMSRGFDRSSRSASSFANGGLRNVSMQLSQVAQQGAASGDYLRALSMQLPDLALGFGTVGIAIGAAGAVLGPFVADLVRGGDEAETTADALTTLGDAVDRYEEAVRQAATPTATLRDEYGELADEAERLFRAQAQLEQFELFSALGGARTAIRDVFGSLEGVSAQVAENYEVAVRGIERMREELAAETDTDRSIELATQIDNLEAAVGRVRPALDNIRESLDLSEQEAGQLLAEFVRFSDAVETTDPAKMLPAAQALRAAYFEAATANGELSESQAEIGRQLVDIENRLFSIVNAQREAGESAEMTADEIAEAALAALDLEPAVRGAAGALDQASSSAAVLARNLGISVENASRLLALQQRRGSGDDAVLDPRDPRYDPVAAEMARMGENYGRTSPFAPSVSSRGSSSGSSGGGSSRPQLDPLAAGRETADQLRKDMQLLGQSAARVAELRAKWAALAAAKQAGIPITEELRGEIEAQAAEVGRLTSELETNRQAHEQLDQAIDEVSGALADALLDAEDWREGMANVFQSLARDILKSGIKQALERVLTGPTGDGGGGGSLLGNALSWLFGRRASGGPMASGQPYLVGENGPELMAPNGNGRILNARQTERVMGNTSGARGGTVRVIVEEAEGFAARVRTEAEDVAVQTVRRAAPQIVSRSVAATYERVQERPLP